MGTGMPGLVAAAVTQEVEQHDPVAPGGQPAGRPPLRLATPTVLRYSYPLTFTSMGGRFPAVSCLMASTGTTIPVLLPVTATVVSNVTLLGSAAIASFCLSPAGSALPSRWQGSGLE
jgi:hypothetical protein